jgi:two-component system cell cycle sensor histidine kinase/response regulator CckA
MASPAQHYEQQYQDGLRTRLDQCQMRLQLLKSISIRINSGLGTSQIVERTLREAHKSFPDLRLSYSTIDSGHVLNVVHSIGSPNMRGVAGFQEPLSHSEPLIQALQMGQVIVAIDVNSDPRLGPLKDFLSRNGTKALVVVPLPQPERQMGLLSLGSNQPRMWNDHEIAIVTDMAEYLAIALREANHQHDRLKIEQQLRDSQKMEAVGRLVGGIAHDFNNLLTGMMIYSGLLEVALGKDNRLQRHVREIRSAGERGAELVGQLLATTSQQVLEPKVVSINDVLMESEDMLRRLIREDIALALHCAGDLKPSRVDPGQLQQVILNLAINARDAMPDGGQLWIETSNVVVDQSSLPAPMGLAAGQYALLSVSDNGHGIDDDTQAHIFEPFFTTKATGKGTGLGLAMVHGIVKQHGGHIAVESQLGQGSTFKVFLPCVDTDSPTERTSTIPKPVHQSLVPAEGESLLLVEDDEMVRRSLVESLRSSGYQVLEASRGDEALKVATRHRGAIRLMITDLIMPGMGGGELAQRLSVERPETDVLFISGYTDDPRTRKLMGSGVEFLGKPFSAAVLLDRVQTILSAAKQAIKLPVPALVRFS